MLQFPSGLFRSELELFSVWDLRKFAFSSQAFSDMKVMSSLNQMNEGSFKIWQFIKAWCQSKGTAGGDRDRAETYWQMELSVTQITATCVSALSSHFKQTHLILDGSRMKNSILFCKPLKRIKYCENIWYYISLMSRWNWSSDNIVSTSNWSKLLKR